MEFEDELAEKFGGDGRNKENHNEDESDKVENNKQTVSDIRKKYERKLAANQGTETEVSMAGHIFSSATFYLSKKKKYGWAVIELFGVLFRFFKSYS